MLPQFHVVAPQSNQCPTIPCVDTTTQLQLRTFNVRILSVNTRLFSNLSEYCKYYEYFVLRKFGAIQYTTLCVDGVTNSLHIMEHLALQVHLSL